MHASGTSGLIAARGDGAIFLTAAKTNEGSVRQGFLLTLRVLLRTQDMILFQHLVRRDEKSVCRVRFLDTDSSRDKHEREHGHTRTDTATRPHPRAHPHAPAHPRTPRSPKTTTTV